VKVEKDEMVAAGFATATPITGIVYGNKARKNCKYSIIILAVNLYWIQGCRLEKGLLIDIGSSSIPY